MSWDEQQELQDAMERWAWRSPSPPEPVSPAVLAGLCQGLWATPLRHPGCRAGVAHNCQELQQPQGQQ